MQDDIYLLSAAADRQMAEGLAAGMKKYRLPRGIRSANGLDSHKLFLDCGEAPIDEEAERLLREAGYLIVLFSPAAIASQSLLDKLYYFEKDTGRENIVPVIAEGEPADIFPPMFIQHHVVQHILPDLSVVEMDETIEPVAADLRGITPKRRREALQYETVRITASVMDLHPDALEQRHRRRKRRAVTAVVSFLAAVLMVVAAIFTVLGIRAHNQGMLAEKQAAIAVQAADRLISGLPETFADEPQAQEILADSLAQTRQQLSENGLDRFITREG
ncbi:MAG: hypothetical protein MJ135_03975 [Oscillospiraceae bacterium]|nr:hypothetical protein [Oscillospiraceae bacterium]